VMDLLRSHPDRTYVFLCELLRDAHSGVAPAQLASLRYAEARESNCVREAAMDSLYRWILHFFPDGWGGTEFACVRPFVMWSTNIAVAGNMPELVDTARRVTNRVLDCPPAAGWKPGGPADPYLVAAFDAAWPRCEGPTEQMRGSSLLDGPSLRGAHAACVEDSEEHEDSDEV